MPLEDPRPGQLDDEVSSLIVTHDGRSIVCRTDVRNARVDGFMTVYRPEGASGVQPAVQLKFQDGVLKGIWTMWDGAYDGSETIVEVP